jgi:hypothetical protein
MKHKCTSDGIPLTDWERVSELATEIANAALSDDDARTRDGEKRMRAYLRELQAKHGALPSILEIMGCYTDGRARKEKLFKQAFEIAQATRDYPNKTSIADSLANLYINEFRDIEQARIWLEILRACLSDHSDSSDQRSCDRLASEFEALIARKKRARKK